MNEEFYGSFVMEKDKNSVLSVTMMEVVRMKIFMITFIGKYGFILLKKGLGWLNGKIIR